MASTKKVNILLSLKDRFSKPLAGTTKEIRKARQEMKLGQNQINKWGNSINNAFTGAVKNAAKFTAAMGAAGAAMGFKEVTVDELMLLKFENKAILELEVPFKFADFNYIDMI